MLPTALAAAAAFSLSDGNAYQPPGLRVAVGDTVRFAATDGHPLAFDGEPGAYTGAVERTYGVPGSVAFYCTNHGGPGGGGMSGRLTIGTANQPPQLALERETVAPRAGGLVVFRALAADPERIPFLLEWDLDGNGTYERSGGASAGATYAAGDHTIRVRVTDDLGLTADAALALTVPAEPSAEPPPAPIAPDAADRAPPALSVTAGRRVRAGATVRVRATVSEDARLVAELRTARGARLARVARDALAGRTTVLGLRPRRAVTGHRLRLVVTATDAAGNATVRRAGIRIHRRAPRTGASVAGPA